MMKTYNVALVNVGERIPANIDLFFLSKKLNSLQHTFSFGVATSIPAEVLAKPDLGGQWYYFKRIFGILQNHKDYPSYDYFIGITHVRLTENKNSVDAGNRDYFCSSDLLKTSLITLNHNVTVYNSHAKDLYQFLTHLIVGELLCNISKHFLYHDKMHLCVFDECIDRANLAPALDNSNICTECHLVLKNKGVSESVLNDIRKILDWCRRPTGKRAPLYRAIVHPLTSLVVGVAIGWFSVFIKPEYYLYVVIGTFTVPILLYIYFAIKQNKELKRF